MPYSPGSRNDEQGPLDHDSRHQHETARKHTQRLVCGRTMRKTEATHSVDRYTHCWLRRSQVAACPHSNPGPVPGSSLTRLDFISPGHAGRVRPPEAAARRFPAAVYRGARRAHRLGHRQEVRQASAEYQRPAVSRHPSHETRARPPPERERQPLRCLHGAAPGMPRRGVLRATPVDAGGLARICTDQSRHLRQALTFPDCACFRRGWSGPSPVPVHRRAIWYFRQTV